MAKLYASPVNKKWSQANQTPEEEVNLVATQINGGINNYIDPADIPDNQVTQAKNVRINGDKIFRRIGCSNTAFLDQGAPPNSSFITNISLFPRFDGSSEFVRFDPLKLYKRDVATWTQITGPPFTVETRQKTLATLDRFFFATGHNVIQEINFTTDTYAPLGNAPKYKYICSFFNRIVGANLYDAGTASNPIQIGWSGDLNFSEWNALVDISAGNAALVEGQGDFSDPITGLFGFASVMLIARERSLWIATKRAVASAPFQYQAAFTNVGCDTPDSIAQTKAGITWYDRRSNQVYTYEVGGTPKSIGYTIRKELKNTIRDNTLVQGSYDPIGNRYHLTIPSSSSDTSIIYVFDFETQSWVYDERYRVSGVFPLDEAKNNLVIADLVGVIADLVGVIADLSNITISPSVITYGHIDGMLTQDDDTAETDNGSVFESIIKSKVFALNPSDLSVNRLLMKLVPIRPGSMQVYFSRNGGQTFTLYKSVSLPISDIGKRRIVEFNKHITTSEFAWKIVSSSGSFDLNEYRIRGLQTTDTRPK